MNSRNIYIAALIIITVVVIGTIRAHGLKWYCDDIFITLRYAENFLAGQGFVYNPGERVEGYTHLLWLALLTLAQKLGLDPLATSLYLGLGSLVGVILLFSLVTYRLYVPKLGFFLPFTAIALAANYDFLVWATSGMETMFFTFLLTSAFAVYYVGYNSRKKTLFFTGLLLILAVLTRPDGALFYILANLLLTCRMVATDEPRSNLFKEILIFNAAFCLLYIPYTIWKLSYYGDIFPNTYYAKSAHLSYFSQGFFYIWTYSRAYVSSILLLVLPLLLLCQIVPAKRILSKTHRRNAYPVIFTHNKMSPLLVVLAGIVVYGVLFIARVGGDFMYARLIIPLIPFIYFVIEATFVTVLPRPVSITVFCLLPFLILTVEKDRRDSYLLDSDEDRIVPIIVRGIFDERAYYTGHYIIDIERRIGESLEPYFRDLDATVLLRGQACLAYYAKFRRCIENTGLTDKYIAHLPLQQRGRIGHEKSAPYDYLVQEGVDFLFRRQPLKDRNYRQVIFPVLNDRTDRAEILTYDRNLIGELSHRLGAKLQYTNFETYLDQYISNELPKKSHNELVANYREFLEYYFLHNDDPPRQQHFTTQLAKLTAPN